MWGGGGGPPAEGAHRDPGLGALAGAHTADRPKFGGGLSPAFEPSEADLEWVCKRVGGGSARARRLGTPHRPPAPPICAPRARRTRDGDDARRSCVRRPSPIAEVPPPIVAGGARMGAPGTRSPGVASPPSRPPGSTAEWRQRQASPGLHRTLPSRRGGVADNPSPFAGGGAMLARTSARSPGGATPSYSPPGSAMVSRQGQTSPGLLHPPPSRGGGGANSADAPWRATRDSTPVGGGSPGPQRVGGGFSGCSQVVDPALRLFGRPPRRARRLERRRRALGRWCTRVRGCDQAAEPGPRGRWRRRGGPTGWWGDLPRLVAGRVTPVGTPQGAPGSASGRSDGLPPHPPPHSYLISPGAGSSSPHARRFLPSSHAAERAEVRCGWSGVAAHADALPSKPHRGER